MGATESNFLHLDRLVEYLSREVNKSGSAAKSGPRRSPTECHKAAIAVTLQTLERLGCSLTPAIGNVWPLMSRKDLLREAEQLLADDEPLTALMAVQSWHDANSSDKSDDLRLLQGRALLRSRAIESARELLESLRRTPLRDAILANVYKQRYFSNEGTQFQTGNDLERAIVFYRNAYEKKWPDGRQALRPYRLGMNLATLSAARNRLEAARELATKLEWKCRGLARKSQDYKLFATLGELALINGRVDNAVSHYRRALQTAQAQGIRVWSTTSDSLLGAWHNARLLLKHLNLSDSDRQEIRAALQPPPIVMFVGHMIDRPGRPMPRFPLHIVADVRRELQRRLHGIRPGISVSGAACGSDLLFLESMQELREHGAESIVVLPCPREQFKGTSIEYAGDEWVERFHGFVGHDDRPGSVRRVVLASDRRVARHSVVFQFENQLKFGLAQLEARRLGTRFHPLVVWDRSAGDGPGGTSWVVQLWKQQGIDLADENVVDIEKLRRRTGEPGVKLSLRVPIQADTRPARVRLEAKVMSILFADVKNYSQLDEEQLIHFVTYFVGGVNNELATSLAQHKPVYKRRIGDALYLAFETPRDAAFVALHLADWMADKSVPKTKGGESYWKTVGLTDGLSIRIALHCGPLFKCDDPLIGVATYEGMHVIHAARIEAVARPNCVFASEQFAALAATTGQAADFTCEYAGLVPLPKQFGTYPLYHVRRLTRN